ncbi:hypothetical protein IFM46972_08186 [Aspergillus udagawae]|uniref:Uncharacterized protein n=1 Tax=Aspergillus udagawae TaxID=91492 RepID=A0A8H3P6N7_9EURO|nr:hypothetical protein IFM46972_08186 [Aspergillus udagawae]
MCRGLVLIKRPEVDEGSRSHRASALAVLLKAHGVSKASLQVGEQLEECSAQGMADWNLILYPKNPDKHSAFLMFSIMICISQLKWEQVSYQKVKD